MIKCDMGKSMQISGDESQILTELCMLNSEVYNSVSDYMKKKMREQWDTMFAPWRSNKDLREMAIKGLENLKDEFSKLEESKAKRKFAKRVVTETKEAFSKHEMAMPKEMQDVITFFEDYLKGESKKCDECKCEHDETDDFEELILKGFKKWLLEIDDESEEEE